ncbi:Octanoate-[acyl-carrier-protein]-protein-N-octanoyltransferase (EC [Olavius algarvensis Delta 1 endosymbiont]|nr:Octanoate-[acyl-carrier-protein]-protein-N-octanoyltransferase (EC [Olavius algarvensis Delta 1 endosymbiont]
MMAADKQTGYWLDLGLIKYAPAFTIQEQVLQARLDGRMTTTVILQENFPIFTIGRSGSRNNILASQEALEKRGIEVLEVNRGGDVTYHGPGQLIVSPLLYLGDIGLNANQYLHRLEDLLIELLAGYDIRTGKKDGLPGVWHNEAKIAAVGIAVKHGYTFHGFSLNIDPDLAAFGLINPCGVQQMPVTSMQQVLGNTPPVNQIKVELKKILQKTFVFETRTITRTDLARSLRV